MRRDDGTGEFGEQVRKTCRTMLAIASSAFVLRVVVGVVQLVHGLPLCKVDCLRRRVVDVMRAWCRAAGIPIMLMQNWLRG